MAELKRSVTTTCVRDNETWIKQLNDQSPEQSIALSDLRSSLLRGLGGALASRPHINDSFIEDAVQDSLVLILSRLHQFEGRSQFMTWATSIAIRVAMSKLRRKQWNDVSLEAEIDEGNFKFEELKEVDSQPELHWTKYSILKQMYEVIENDLTEKQKYALLAELKGMPQDEIARLLGSNRNAIYKLTHDARKRLKKGLEHSGLDINDVYAAFIS